ncbi:hypothetical protein [Streptomyces bluensis]|uniref:hypothetical protein n=1 Tax=Streptomyces bluensis TaxID=33897 RepID=UPI00333227C3
MNTATHETSRQVFPDHPDALTPVFEALGVPPPTQSVITALGLDSTEISPLGHRMGTVLKIDPSERDGLLLAIDVQTEQDPDKALSWACHVAYLQMTYDRPALLLVVCRNRSTAAWAAGPFESRLGTWTSQSLHPFVLGPDNLPQITNESMVVRQPALAALAAIAHSESESVAAVLAVLARGLRALDRHTAMYVRELLEAGLMATPARETWRELLREGAPART